MVDTHASGACGHMSMWVQVPPSAILSNLLLNRLQKEDLPLVQKDLAQKTCQ